jgi:hypothetical protein
MLTKVDNNAVKRLSKQDILEGARRRETIHIQELDGDIVIRPLTFGELAKLSSTSGVPMMPDGTPDLSKVDSNDMILKNFDFIKQVVTLGMVSEGSPITPEDVDKMPGGLPMIIAASILELSGWASPEIAKKKD